VFELGVIDPIRDIPIIRSWHTYVSALQYAKSKGFIMFKKYNDRKVAVDVVNEVTISTMAVYNVAPFETAIKHPQYEDGHWCIVEFYDDRELAVLGHKKWLETFSSGKEDWPQGLVSLN